MRSFGFLLVLATAMALAACSDDSGKPNATAAVPTAGAATTASATRGTTAGPAGPVLFTIGMHIEPLGQTAQEQARPAVPGAAASKDGDYNNKTFFDHATQDIDAVATMVEKHGGRMTIQAQSPFTTASITFGNKLLADLEKRGHEIGLHFHESEHMAKNSNSLSPSEWCSVFKEEVGYITKQGVKSVTYWSGGNLYSGLLEAAKCAGFTTNSDWKNPDTQSTNEDVIGTVPWRPAAGSKGTDTSKFALNDPKGPVIFLPEGDFDQTNFASMRRSEEAGGDQAYFDYLATSLKRSIESAVPDRVNVFHFTVHQGEFRGDPKDPFGVIERFLTTVVDPLVKAGKVKWATFAQMADAHKAWENGHPGVDPLSGGR